MLDLCQMNASSLQAIYRFDIPNKVPIHGDISYEELAKLCQIRESDLRRILRFSMAFHRLFRESRKGFVAHTAASRLLAENPLMRDDLGMWFEDCWPSMAQVRESPLHASNAAEEHCCSQSTKRP